VRDLDVQLLELPARQRTLDPDAGAAAGWPELRAALERRRAPARERLRAALDSTRFRALLEGARRLFGAPPARRAGHPGARAVVELAAELLGRLARKFEAAVRECRAQPSPAVLHALRIRGQKLRYACEFFAPLYEERFAEGLARLAEFQDVLGRYQDSVVLGRLALELREEADDASGGYLFVLGQLAAASRLRVEAKLPCLAEALERLGRPRTVRRLAREAKRRAAAVRRTLGPPSEGGIDAPLSVAPRNGSPSTGRPGQGRRARPGREGQAPVQAARALDEARGAPTSADRDQPAPPRPRDRRGGAGGARGGVRDRA